MLSIIIPASIVSIYATGLISSVIYKLVRLSELKFEYETTRSKDTKNECAALARHHVRSIKRSWRWPLDAAVSWLSALKWGAALEKK